jgi:hypothetical protein
LRKGDSSPPKNSRRVVRMLGSGAPSKKISRSPSKEPAVQKRVITPGPW